MRIILNISLIEITINRNKRRKYFEKKSKKDFENILIFILTNQKN